MRVTNSTTPIAVAELRSLVMSGSDDTELDAVADDGAEHTAVIPDANMTETAQLAWSKADDASDIISSATERRPLPQSLRILFPGVVIATASLALLVLWHHGVLGAANHASVASSAPASKRSAASSAAQPNQKNTAGVPIPTAQDAADALRAAIPEVTNTIALTEENDGNNLIGRPNGYTAATVLVDSRVECPRDGPGVDCGATIEQWPSVEAAQRRAEYIQAIGKSLPTMSEWDTVKGNLLLRVAGKLKPSAADRYKALFTG